jgi:hypothetical protein
MPRSIPLEANATIQLDGSGNGTATIVPPVVEQWHVETLSVTTSTAVKVPTCRTYLGQGTNASDFVDGTYNGSQNVSDALANRPIPPGMKILAQWLNGDAGALATVTVRGTKVVQ